MVLLRRLLALAPLATLGLLPSMSAEALPIGSAPDTRPGAMQVLPEWKTFGVGSQLSGLFLSGNAQFMNLDGAVDLATRVDRHQFYLNTGGLYSRTGTTVGLNRISGSGTYMYDLLPHVNVWAFTTHAEDQALALKYRASYSLGLCLDRLGVPGFTDLFLAYGPDYELAWYSDGTEQREWRHVVRLFANRTLTETLDAGLDSFYRPAFTDMADYRLYGETYLRIKLTPLVSLLLTAADEYNTRPRPGFLDNDFGVYTTLRLGTSW